MGGFAQSVQYIATAQALECYADALALLGQFYALLYHVAHLGGQACQHACAFGHQVTAEHLEHAVELTTTKQATATDALCAVAKRVEFLLGFADALLKLLEAGGHCPAELALLGRVGKFIICFCCIVVRSHQVAQFVLGIGGTTLHGAQCACALDGLLAEVVEVFATKRCLMGYILQCLGGIAQLRVELRGLEFKSGYYVCHIYLV